MYRWYVLWVDVQVNLQSSDRLIKITQTENGAVPVVTFLQCHAPLFPNKLQRIVYSWYVLWVDVQVNLQSSDRLIKKIQTESGAIPVMMLHYFIWKPLAAKSTAVFNFAAFEMYTYKSMISHKTTNGIFVNFEKLII